jgi:hypothetical protein
MILTWIRRSIAAVAVAAIALSFAAVAPAMAAEDPGYGPESAVTPNNAWSSLAPGESRWYTFHYDYDQIADEATETIVELKSQYEDAVGFEVWTPRTVQHWANGDDTDTWNPVGAGSKLSEQTGEESDDATLLWVSNGSVSETYYVIVTNARDSESAYNLSISGVDVSFPGLELPAADMVAMTEASPVAAMDVVMAAESTAPSVVPAMDNGSGPFNAMTMAEDTGVLATGESRWYSFDYTYDNSDDADIAADVTVLVKGDTEDSLSFEIWNPQSVQHWINEDDTDDWSAVGAGSKLSNDLGFDNNEQESLSNPYKNELVWVGSSRASDTYYVIITNDTDRSQDFQISITGSSISF